MVNRGTNHLGIDRSKTAGGRKRRNAKQRNDRLRRQNLYDVQGTKYGIYKDEETGDWILTLLGAKRKREKLTSDRRGGTTLETVCEAEARNTEPTNGLQIATFDKKSDATSEYYTPNSWTKERTGSYWGECSRTKSFEVDRDEWREWLTSRHIRRIRS